MTNGAQLYLHSLEPVKRLVEAYEVTHNHQLVNLAIRIAHSWLRYAQFDAQCRFTWYDHAVADRTIYLMYLHATIGEQRLEGHGTSLLAFEERLLRHGEFLASDANYRERNYGTMMDRALYLLSHYVQHPSSPAWRELALRRLREALRRDYSKHMVNLENSSNYHLFNFDLFTSLEKELLNAFGDSLGDDFDDNMSQALRFLVHMSMPDAEHSFPMIGDGPRQSLNRLKRYACYPHVADHPLLQHVLTNGVTDRPPERNVAIYPTEGYAFFRTSWDYAAGLGNIAYASLKAGYQVPAHKHGDDLSFTWRAAGRDIFVDTGTFTYQPGEWRRWFRFAPAHNTLVVDGRPYDYIHGDPGRTGIFKHGNAPGYWYVVAKNDLYPGVVITRTFYFTRSGNVVLSDEIDSATEHTYSQLLHFSHRLDTRDLTTNGAMVSVADEDLTICIRQLVDVDATIVHRGNRTEPGYGLVSETFHGLAESATLEFQQQRQSSRFISVLTVHDITVAEPEVQLSGDKLGVDDVEITLGVNAHLHRSRIPSLGSA